MAIDVLEKNRIDWNTAEIENKQEYLSMARNDPSQSRVSRSLSLPQMDLLHVEDTSQTLGEGRPGNEKPFWQTQTAQIELARARDDDFEFKPPQFSVLHAAAITGNKATLGKLVVNNEDADNRDKVRCQIIIRSIQIS